jgi:hypothetical protein
MKYARLGCLFFGGLLFAGSQDGEINVNTRYTVDAVVVAGKNWRINLESETNNNISSALHKDLVALIGAKLNPPVLDLLAARLRKDFGAREVTHRVMRAEQPEHVTVEFQVKQPRGSIDIGTRQFLYNSREGWSGAGEARVTVHRNVFAFGVASDGDALAERYAGISARYENTHPGTDRVNLRFEFSSYHQQWNPNTVEAAAAHLDLTSEPYRARQEFAPSVAIALARPLTLEVGARFSRLEDQDGNWEASNGVAAGLRYNRTLEGDLRQEIEAAYGLRASTRLLASDFAYASHMATIRYQLKHGRHELVEEAGAGAIGGRAPLADRFYLGNSYRLRGWNKYDLDPIGGNRLVYNSVEYRYGYLKVFYDTGAVWDDGQPVPAKHSVGVGVRASGITLAVAFPLRSGRVDPVFIMGMIY